MVVLNINVKSFCLKLTVSAVFAGLSALLFSPVGAAHAQTLPPDAVIPVQAYCETNRTIPTYVAAIKSQALGEAASRGVRRAKVSVTIKPFFTGPRDPMYLEPSAVIELYQDFSFNSLADDRERERSLNFLAWGCSESVDVTVTITGFNAGGRPVTIQKQTKNVSFPGLWLAK